MIISTIGVAGSGKTTLSRRLALDLKYEYIGAGDVARELAKYDEETRDALNNGQFAPRYKMNKAMVEIVNKDPEVGMVLDGFPRYMEQLLLLKENAVQPVYYVVVGCELEEAKRRLRVRGRADDNNEQIEQRIANFLTETVPVIMELLDKNARRTLFVSSKDPLTNDPDKLFRFVRDRIRMELA